MIKKGFSHIGVFFLYLLALLPLPVLHFFARLLYYPLYHVIGYRRKVVRDNLLFSFPEKSLKEIIRIEKSYYKYLADLMFEIIKLTHISKAVLRKRVKFTGLEQVEAYFKNGKGILSCTGHYGNWELCMLALGINLSKPSYVIYKPINNKVFEGWFQRMRTQFGNIFIPMRQTLRSVIATRDEPNIYCFASDQTPVKQDSQYILQFLNQPTAVLMGLEKIALQTDKPVFYFDVIRLKRGYYQVNCLPLCLKPSSTQNHEITNLLFNYLEKRINDKPDFWLWSHRRWKITR